MNRLMEKIVFSGFVMDCRLATCPTISSLVFGFIATTEGVRRLPSAFGITTGSPPSMTATTELVVPKSIPIIFAIFLSPLARIAGWANPDECRPEDPIMQPVSALKLRNDGRGLTGVAVTHDRIMLVRVEFLAECLDWLEPVQLQNVLELALDEQEPLNPGEAPELRR